MVDGTEGTLQLDFTGTVQSKKYKNNIPLGSLSFCSTLEKRIQKAICFAIISSVEVPVYFLALQRWLKACIIVPSSVMV